MFLPVNRPVMLSIAIALGYFSPLMAPGRAAAAPTGTAPSASASGVAKGAAGSPAIRASVAGHKLLDEIDVFRQIQTLALTPAQLQEITRRLTWMKQAEAVHASRVDAASAAVLPELRRVDLAVLQGKTPTASDETPAHTALAPLQTEGKQVIRYENTSIAGIRAVLTPEQLRAMRIMLGIDAPAAASAVSVNPPGAAIPGTGSPGQAGQAGQAAAANPTAAGPASRRRRPSLSGLFDRMRKMPQSSYDQAKTHIASRMARRMGLKPGTADFTAEESELSSEFDNLREIPAPQYAAERTKDVRDLTTKIRQARGQAPGGSIPDGTPTTESPRQLMDDDVVRQFFLRDGALEFLRSRAEPVPHAAH